MTVLFLCTANICRSPVAEHYLRQLGTKLGLPRLVVRSAGVLDYTGAAADAVAARLAHERGLDLSRHRSRLATDEEFAATDLVVVMQKRHRAWVREHAPAAMPKTRLLREYLDGAHDVPDPTGQDEAAYRAAFAFLFAATERLAMSLRYPA